MDKALHLSHLNISFLQLGHKNFTPSDVFVLQLMHSIELTITSEIWFINLTELLFLWDLAFFCSV